jgi:predicted nucleotidyltransferase
MNFNVKDRTILLVKHGSHAYGLNIESSDVDVKGVCIEPAPYYFGFANRFDQAIELVITGHACDSTIFALRKFARLAIDCNPNIIEVLFGDDEDVMFADQFGCRLRAIRHEFLSLKAKHTFSGYAFSQRIKTHRSWLLNPPAHPPERKSYGMGMGISDTEMGAFEALDSKSKASLSNEALAMFSRERAYRTALAHWNQYNEWKANRNPARAATEATRGYDTKHGMHLIRLMRMCKEMLTTGDVIVRRPDREELLAIRRGDISYDDLVSEAERLERECDLLYTTSTVLPRVPNQERVDEYVMGLTKDYLRSKGEL